MMIELEREAEGGEMGRGEQINDTASLLKDCLFERRISIPVH